MKCPKCQQEAGSTTPANSYYCPNCNIYFGQMEENKEVKINLIRAGEN